MEERPAIRLQGALTERDLRGATFFGMFRRYRIVIFLALGVVGLLTFFLLVSGSADDESVLLNAVPFFVLCALWLLSLAVIPYRTAKSRYANEAAWREVGTYTFSPEGVAVSRPSASSELKWNLITEACETKTLFLLYMGKTSMIVVPKRFFGTETKMGAWRSLVSAQVKSGISQRILVSRWC